MEVEGCHFSSNLGILVEPKIHFEHSALVRFSHSTSYPVGYREMTSEYQALCARITPSQVHVRQK